MPDHHGAARRQPLGAAVGAVIVARGGLLHALAGGLVHLRVAIERTADRRLRKTKLLSQGFEVHSHSKRFQVLPIFLIGMRVRVNTYLDSVEFQPLKVWVFRI